MPPWESLMGQRSRRTLASIGKKYWRFLSVGETIFDPDYDIFLDIVTSGSISAAARNRGASVSGLSKRLSRLERRSGVRLTHRNTRRLSLTEAGKDLADTLLAARANLNAVENRLAGRRRG